MSGSFLVSILAAVTVTTALSLAAARLARRSRAAFRHVLLSAALGVLLVLPVAAIVVPVVQVPVPVSATPEFVAPAVEAINEFISIEHAAGSSSTPTAVDAPRSIQWPSSTTLAAIAWLAGAILFSIPFVVGLGQIRLLRRSGLPWPRGAEIANRLAAELGLRVHVDVLLHESAVGPMTCGVFRRTVLLPTDVGTWPAEDLERAMVHELEHVRRGDWLSQCAARLICAAYWFHPLVWVVRRELGLEAERACDDAVLLRAEAMGYADQLVNLAKRLSAAHHQPLLAMANRDDLTTRIRALLDRQQARGRAGALAIWMACAVSAGLVFAMSPLRIVTQAAVKATAGDVPRWEAVSIKPCEPEKTPVGRGGGPGGPTVSPGRLRFDCTRVRMLINLAYLQNRDPGVAGETLERYPSGPPSSDADRPVRGGPDWLTKDTYSIEAKAEGTPSQAVMLGPMLRALLEDRFRLKVHVATEDAPMYTLTVAPAGLKIKPMPPGSCAERDPDKPVTPDEVAKARAAGKLFCNTFSAGANGSNFTWEIAGQLSMLASALSWDLGQFVEDHTGIHDQFQVHLEYAPDERTSDLARRTRGAPSADAASGPSIFRAVEQLGLKLQPSRGQRAFIAIDQVERPTPDDQVTTAPQKFEAASIKPCPNDEPPRPATGGARSGQGGFPTTSPGRFTIECGTVERLISNAYVLHGERLTNNDARIGDVSWWKGGPEWIRYDKFTIEAVASGVSDREILLGPMLRALLEDRFKLQLHRETREAPMYALTVAKGGLKLQPMAPDGCQDPDTADRSDPRGAAAAVLAGTAKPYCGAMTMAGTEGRTRWTIGGTTLSDFAHTLSASMDHYVIDRTGLADTKFNIHLEFAPDEHVPGGDKRNPRTEFAPPDAPLIFNAVEQQLGLKLEPIKGPQGVLVVDHIERPTFAGATVGTPTPPARAKGSGR